MIFLDEIRIRISSISSLSVHREIFPPSKGRIYRAIVWLSVRDHQR